MNIQNRTRWDFIGLSTEEKPSYESNYKVTDGSTFYEADTSTLYVWTQGEWYEKTGNVLTNIDRRLKW